MEKMVEIKYPEIEIVEYNPRYSEKGHLQAPTREIKPKEYQIKHSRAKSPEGVLKSLIHKFNREIQLGVNPAYTPQEIKEVIEEA